MEKRQKPSKEMIDWLFVIGYSQSLGFIILGLKGTKVLPPQNTVPLGY